MKLADVVEFFVKAYKHAKEMDDQWLRIASLNLPEVEREKYRSLVRNADDLLEEARVLLFEAIGEKA